MHRQASPPLFHRMDAVSKFIWILLVPVIGYVINDLRLQVGLVVGLVLVANLLAGISPRRLVRNFAWVVVLAGSLFFFHNVLRPAGPLVFEWGAVRLYGESLARGAAYAFRILVMALTAAIFVETTSPRALVVGLVHLGTPYRLAWTLLLALRYLPMMRAEVDAIRDAQLVRGVRRGGLVGQLEMYRRYTIPLLASILRKAEDTALAMDGRGFGAFERRVFVDDFRWTTSGRLLVAFTVLLFGVVVAARLSGTA